MEARKKIKNRVKSLPLQPECKARNKKFLSYWNTTSYNTNNPFFRPIWNKHSPEKSETSHKNGDIISIITENEPYTDPV